MPGRLRALRGATTVDEDTREQVFARTIDLLTTLFERNSLRHDDIVSVIFTATDDIHSAFPAAAAREFGLGDVPLLCAHELDIDGGMPLCIRALLHVETDASGADMRHVYLAGAVGLRDDLPG